MRGRRLPITLAQTVSLLAFALVAIIQHDSLSHAQQVTKDLTAIQSSQSVKASGDTQIVSGGVLNRKAVKNPAPTYPVEARAARVTGTVVVQIVVDEKGIVEKAKAISGHPLLREAAVHAAYEARFAPTRISGRPVKVSGKLVYRFARTTVI